MSATAQFQYFSRCYLNEFDGNLDIKTRLCPFREPLHGQILFIVGENHWCRKWRWQRTVQEFRLQNLFDSKNSNWWSEKRTYFVSRCWRSGSFRFHHLFEFHCTIFNDLKSKCQNPLILFFKNCWTFKNFKIIFSCI